MKVRNVCLNRSPEVSRASCLLTSLVLATLLTGCGGSTSGTSTPIGPPAPTGNVAIRAASLAALQAVQAVSIFPNQVVTLTAPTGSTVAAANRGVTRGLTFVPALNLYSSTTSTSSQITIRYFTDAGGSVSAGSIVITAAAGTFSSAKYPVTVNATAKVTAGKFLFNGTTKLVILDAAGTNQLSSSITLPTSGESLILNTKMSSLQQLSGSLAIQEESTTLNFAGLQGTFGKSATGSLEASPGNYSGSSNFDFSGIGETVDFENASAKANAATHADGTLEIQYADGSRETIPLPIYTTLISGSATEAPQYKTPISMTAVQSSIPGNDNLNGFSVNGHMVATQNNENSQLPLYYATPTSQPVYLQSLRNGGAGAVNSSSVIVGGDLNGACCWPSPTSNQVLLKAPPGLTALSLTLFAINDSGGIVGVAVQNGTERPYYWKSYTAAPVSLSEGSYAADLKTITGMTIDNNGQILADVYTGSQSAGAPNAFIWSSPSGSPAPLSGSQAKPSGFSDYGAVGSVASTTSEVPTVWKSPSLLPETLSSLPNGLAYGPAVINNHGLSGGLANPLSTAEVAAVCPPGGTPVDLSDLIPTTPAFSPVLRSIVVIFDDGSLIASDGEQDYFVGPVSG